MVRKSFHVLPTLSPQTALDRIAVESSAKSEKEDSQEKREEVGRFKIKDSHEICVERKLTASLITNVHLGEETKPRLFLLEILQLLVICFCSTLQSSELNTDCHVGRQQSTCSTALTAMETGTDFKDFLTSPWPLYKEKETGYQPSVRNSKRYCKHLFPKVDDLSLFPPACQKVSLQVKVVSELPVQK